ncbi:MAG TPA: DUF1015 domain-containing protein [Actinopolymorphaceae bacterium]|nr:DUF1015 domain-containing protein [Actinopolymorphaceae bacterium]
MPRVTDAATGTRPLVLSPFRGLRYAPGRVSDLAAVTSPPYDVLDRDSIAALAAGEPHNIVRVILPRHAGAAERGLGSPPQPGDDAAMDPYRRAADLLRKWRAEGILVADPDPALYVYEQYVVGPAEHQNSAPASAVSPDVPSALPSDPTSAVPPDVPSAGFTLRGLLGAVGLRSADEHVILPHEDVLPGPVADRLALMRSCAANLEPILLAYDGGGTASELVEATVTSDPMVQAQTPDGTRHRLWRITDRGRIAEIAADLAPRQALIADGHHRYATYLRLRDELRASGAGDGPWDYGLALLVDQRVHPLELTAIHRLISDLTLADAVERLTKPPVEIQNYRDDAVAARRALAACRRAGHGFLLTDGDGWSLARVRLGARVPLGQPAVTSDRPTMGGREPFDTEILHEFLLSQLLGVADDRIEYAHDEETATRIAREHNRLAVILNPVELTSVQAVAREGGRMPRKSTSFGPKPRAGFVMLDFADN